MLCFLKRSEAVFGLVLTELSSRDEHIPADLAQVDVLEENWAALLRSEPFLDNPRWQDCICNIDIICCGKSFDLSLRNEISADDGDWHCRFVACFQNDLVSDSDSMESRRNGEIVIFPGDLPVSSSFLEGYG